MLKLIAHDIRDNRRLTARAMRHLESASRWALTGTPIQNNLLDVASLYQFLRVYPYTDPRIFKAQITQLGRHRAHDGVDKIKRLIRCITLRRSIATVTLPERRDLVCRLDFSPEEAAIYDRVKKRTNDLLDDATDTNTSSVSEWNLLPWINSLRIICNLGTRAKVPTANVASQVWDARAAQETFNALVTAGSAICGYCSLDLGAVATEVADDSVQPQLSSCSRLVCAACVDKHGHWSNFCGHDPSHPVLPVSTLSSTLSSTEDHANETEVMPTKIKALMQDLEQHVHDEKRYVRTHVAFKSGRLTPEVLSFPFGQVH